MNQTIQASVVASFADGCMALVSPEDTDLSSLRWRRDSYGYVLRSQGKRNIMLARDIADRMGLAPGGIGYKDGDRLNCTRENIVLRRPGMDRRGQSRRSHTRQPTGLHRFQLRRPPAAGYVPPDAYMLKWHAGDCIWLPGESRAGSKSCALAESGRVVGVAERLTRTTPVPTHKWNAAKHKLPTFFGGNTQPDGWKFTDLTGDNYPSKSYDEGCQWVLAGLDLAVRYVPALNQGPVLRLMQSLEGS